MLLAIATLIFHLPAVPQRVVQSATPAADSSATAVPAETPKPPQPIDQTSYAANSAIAPLGLNLNDWPVGSGPKPDSTVAYAPGQLAPEPVAPVNDLLEVAPAAAPESLAPGAIQSVADQSAVQAREQRHRRHVWIALSIAEHSTAAFDAGMTRRAIGSGAGQELNPMLRPFATNASLYLAVQVVPTFLDYVGERMMNNQRHWARRTWWVPQAVSTALSFAGGVHNIGVHP